MAVDPSNATATAGVDPSRIRVAGAIKQAASSTGTSFEYLLATAKMESDFNPTAGASTSSAHGLYQFIDQTWLGTVKEAGSQLGYGSYADAISKSSSGTYSVSDPAARTAVMKLRDDPVASSAMAAALSQSNSFQLTGKIGRRPTNSELYMAHFMGVGGAAKLISSAEDTPQASGAALFPNAAAANRSIFFDRNGSARSVSDVYSVLNARYAGAANSSATRTALATFGASPSAATGPGTAVVKPAFLSNFPDVGSVATASASTTASTSAPAQRSRLICSAIAAGSSAAKPSCKSRRAVPAAIPRPRTLNKTSIRPAVYGERFVKRHGLFSLTVASRRGAVSSCVSRQGHDRSAVHQLDTDRSGGRAGGSNAILGAGLAGFRSHQGRSRRRRRRASDAARRCVAAGAPGHGRNICAQQRCAGCDRAGAVARSGVGGAAGARTFTAVDRCRPRRHRRDRQLRNAMRRRPPCQSAGLGLRGDRRSRHRFGGAGADRKCLCRTRAVFMGPHRRASRPSCGDPGIDAGAGRSAGRDAGGAGRQAFRHADAIRCRPQLAQPRSRGPDCRRGARSFDREYRGALAGRRHAWPGPAFASHRRAHRRTDPARAIVGQS